jgi:hypothetical protein
MLCSLTTDSFCNRSAVQNYLCHVFPSTNCEGARNFTKAFQCRYCYQTENAICNRLTNCRPGLGDHTTACRATVDCIGPSR